jgi:predicted acylesterase/phospholipase RssA
MNASINPGKPKYCDMVMKGGITSGVVYPTAICELASQYQFRNIGGASAGAIAAAAAAAAEFGRQNGVPDSFTQFGKLPDEFGKPGFLPGLFMPDGTTRSAYKTLLGVLAAKPGPGRVVSLVFGLLRQYWQSALIGAAVAAFFVAVLLRVGSVPIDSLRQRLAIGILGLLWIIAGVSIVVVLRVLSHTTRAVVENGFGLSNGLNTNAEGNAPLTNWMYALFNRLAGLPNSRPLVFADLWKGRQVKEDDVVDLTEERRINLEVVTTNLNHLSPYTVPFRNDTFYFDPQEWALLFPREVVSWMKEHAAEVQRPVVSAGRALLPLPRAGMLPIIVAARLSLSFPGLVSAVPLYAVDFSLKRNQDKTAPNLEADRCWFSDGGICSNFPVHFFDSPIPAWPTFAINLKEPHPDFPADPVWLPSSNGSGTLASVKRFDPTGKPLAQLVEFVGAILSTTMDWRDNLQTRMPGYRNRIVHISLNKNEGGLNLTMPPQLIDNLTKRGALAGRKLRDEFNWPQHVWARYRTTMCILERHLRALGRRYRHPFSEDGRIRQWLDGTATEPTPGYPWKNQAEKAFAAAETASLAGVTENWDEKGSFCETAPLPEPGLRAQPKF